MIANRGERSVSFPIRVGWIRGVLIISMGLLSACASFEPKPIEDVPFLGRAQTQTEGGVTVTVAVPGPEESKQLFGVSLSEKKIQPVWLHVENKEEVPYFLLPISLDQDYFSPQEAAWKMRFFLGGETNLKLMKHFQDKGISFKIPSGETVEGFVHTNLDLGVKYVSVTLFYPGRIKNFDFVFEIPGMAADYKQVDWAEITAAMDIREVDDESLRKALEALPCCVLGGDRKTPGDPLNIVVIGEIGHLAMPFVRRGWQVTEIVSGSSVWRTIMSSLFGVHYRNSPISSLYLYDRRQDIALQKPRDSVDERNHLRLWLAPLRYKGMAVWVGQISRDIGVRLSSKTLTTHKIDPDVDETRVYLIQDLLYSGSLAKIGFVGGVGKATPKSRDTTTPEIRILRMESASS